MFCADCLKKLPFITGRRCPACGGFLSGIFESCSDCLSSGERPWHAAYAVFSYRDAAAEAVRLFKFGKRTALAKPFGRFMAESLPDSSAYDFLVPVPLHWFRFLQRGFNQSLLLAEEVSGRTGIPVLNALYRTRYTRHQAFLNREERLKNIHGVFSLRSPETIRGKKILLIDDVMTTGTTLEEAVRMLLKSAAEVDVLVLARRQRT